MQDDLNYWYDMAKLLFEGDYENIDYDNGEKAVDRLLLRLSAAEKDIKKRLEELSGI